MYQPSGVNTVAGVPAYLTEAGQDRATSGSTSENILTSMETAVQRLQVVTNRLTVLADNYFGPTPQNGQKGVNDVPKSPCRVAQMHEAATALHRALGTLEEQCQRYEAL